MKELKYEELVNMIEPGRKHPILINALPKEDFLQTHIPGSINLPVDQIEKHANGLFAKHDWIVVYCASTKCNVSHAACEKLQKLGFTNVFRFTGGVEEWKKHSQYTCCETKQPKGTRIAA